MGLTASSGRMVAEDGTIVNIADVIGGEHTGEYMEIDKMMPHTGRFVSETGEVINVAKKIGSGGSGGSGGSTVSITAEKAGGVTTLTINNDGDTKTVEILDGADGQNGSDGKNGADGQNGADGKTPVKGVDYWTEEDKAEMKTYIDEAILGGEW